MLFQKQKKSEPFPRFALYILHTHHHKKDSSFLKMNHKFIITRTSANYKRLCSFKFLTFYFIFFHFLFVFKLCHFNVFDQHSFYISFRKPADIFFNICFAYFVNILPVTSHNRRFFKSCFFPVFNYISIFTVFWFIYFTRNFTCEQPFFFGK